MRKLASYIKILLNFYYRFESALNYRLPLLLISSRFDNLNLSYLNFLYFAIKRAI